MPLGATKTLLEVARISSSTSREGLRFLVGTTTVLEVTKGVLAFLLKGLRMFQDH